MGEVALSAHAPPSQAPSQAGKDSVAKTMACSQCGSWTIRADRSLAGRMVCGRCGTPIKNAGSLRSRRRSPWRLVALAVVATAAALAALEPATRQPQRLNGSLEQPEERGASWSS